MNRYRSIAILVVFLFAACGVDEQSNEAVEASATTETTTATAAKRPDGPRFRAVARSAVREGRGQLKLFYGKTSTAERRELAKVLREERLFEDVIDNLNAGLVLRDDVQVRLQECGEVNAFYSPDDKQIQLCYELYDHFTNIFENEDVPAEEAATKSVAALIFVFYHELGHALIDVYDLPVTGREEDAVDQLATVLLLETWDGEDSELAILSSAEWFDLDASEREDDPDMADEHALDEQRYYNLVCWIYGSDPEYFSGMADDWGLPEARAQRCTSEYERMSGAWGTLLGPHMRETEGP